MKRREFVVGTGAIGLLAACGGGAVPPAAPSATPVALIRAKLGSVSVSAANSAIWAAEDGGYLKKYGLDAEVVNIADSTQAVAALLSGEVPLNCGISGTAVVASSLQGSDLVMLGVTVNTFPSSLYAKQSIQSVAGLKGMKIGVSRFGTASDTGGRISLRRNGLDPAKDATFLQFGGLNEILAALQTGQIDAGVLSPPHTVLARAAGFKELVDMGALGIEYFYNGVATTRAFAKQNGTLVENALKALIEGAQRFKTDEAFGKSIVQNRTKLTDASQVEETWRLFATKYLTARAFVTPGGIQTVIDEVAQREPKAQWAKPMDFYDDSFMKKLDESGFIKSIVR